MEVFNLEGEQDWDSENDREGFRHRATRATDAKAWASMRECHPSAGDVY